MRNEFEDIFNSLAQMNYAIIFIGHDEMSVVTRPDVAEYNVITPALSPTKVRAIIANMADVYGYAHCTYDTDGMKQPAVLTLRDNTGMITCGTRFKYMKDEIPFTYDSLVTEIGRAIDEAEANGAEITSDAPVLKPQKDFNKLMDKFNELVSVVQSNVTGEEFETVWGPKITGIIDDCLGAGKKVSDLTDKHVDQLDLIVSTLAEEIGNGL